MIKTFYMRVRGPAPDIQALKARINPRSKIDFHTLGATLYVYVEEHSEDHKVIQDAIAEKGLDCSQLEEVDATPEELSSVPLFRVTGARWIWPDQNVIDKPVYTHAERCPECGYGSRELAQPLRGKLPKSYRKYLVIRLPPALVLAPRHVADLIDQEGWTGVEVQPLIDRQTGEASRDFVHLWITSILPAMHHDAPIVEAELADICNRCKKLGYTLEGHQPWYASDVVPQAADWNLSQEWLGASYDPCPFLICTQRVVQKLRSLDPKLRCVPVHLV